jgi:DNA ligase-associated metallophosphoesterase
MTSTNLVFRGESCVLDPAGVLFWPRLSLLAVADLHLEKGTACARQGQLVPPWDSRVTLERLGALVRQYRPATLVALGDSFHDDHAPGRLEAAELAALASLALACRMIWVCGNHDPAPPHGVQGDCMATFSCEGLVFRHQAAPRAEGEISGHFHPKARVATRAGQIVRPCFINDTNRVILPAFGAYTGGLDINSPAISGLFPAGGTAFLLGRDKLFRFHLPRTRKHVLAAGDAAASFA